LDMIDIGGEVTLERRKEGKKKKVARNFEKC
jgi:hypothetical protein